jgi:hypothetical protein
MFGQQLRGRAPDAARGAGDDRGLALQHSHPLLLVQGASGYLTVSREESRR